RRNGVSLSDARNQYLNYHEGQSGYARGSYKRKRWLMLVADKVAKRAAQYRTQLRKCRV
ncbi:MAG: transglycosylase SLT domain-containing protein, partial [Rhodobacterales bacterium]